MSDYSTSVGFIALALLLNFVMAWVLGFASQYRNLGPRIGVSVVASLIGAAIIYGMIWRGLWPLFGA